MDSIGFKKLPTTPSPELLSNSEEVVSKAKNFLFPEINLSFRKIEQVRDYYLDAIKRSSKIQSNTDTNKVNKLKGLEEIGVFAEFTNYKKIYSDTGKSASPKTIHMTDFMRRKQRKKLLNLVGQTKAFENRKKELKREMFGRELAFKNFFLHKEKSPSFYNTPLQFQKTGRETEKVMRKTLRMSPELKIEKLDSIIDKCNLAMGKKPKFNYLTATATTFKEIII